MVHQMAMLGNVCVATGDSQWLDGLQIILGYGLIGMGGMGVYLSSFQVVNLYDVKGFPCSVLSCIFNISGMFFHIVS